MNKIRLSDAQIDTLVALAGRFDWCLKEETLHKSTVKVLVRHRLVHKVPGYDDVKLTNLGDDVVGEYWDSKIFGRRPVH